MNGVVFFSTPMREEITNSINVLLFFFFFQVSSVSSIKTLNSGTLVSLCDAHKHTLSESTEYEY